MYHEIVHVPTGKSIQGCSPIDMGVKLVRDFHLSYEDADTIIRHMETVKVFGAKDINDFTVFSEWRL